MTSTEPGGDRRTAAAIEAYARWQAEAISAAGGVRGRPLRIVAFDDANDAAKTVANVDAALALDDLLGIVGVWSSTRGAAVVERIGASGAPFVSEISRQELIEPYPNIFSMARAASADLPAFVAAVTQPKRRVTYFGVEGDLFTLQFKETLERLASEERVEVAAWEWAPASGDWAPEAIDASIDRLRADRPDLLVLAVGSSRGGALLGRLAAAGITTPAYAASGSVVRMLGALGDGDYAGELLQTRSSVPGVTNSRLEALLQRPDFVAVGADFAPGDRSYGASYADIVAVMAEAANSGSTAEPSLEVLRADLVAALAESSRGTRIFRGATRDWVFDRGGSAIEPVYLLRRPAGSRELTLAPSQIDPSAAGEPGAPPRRVPIVHVGIDLVEVSAIDTLAETFDASFYLTLESADGLTIADLEFANAARSDLGAASILATRELPSRLGASPGARLRLYRVDGRFQFDPDLTRYPFDRQVFSIQIQPTDTTAPFVLQPPPERLRDRAFDVPGWRPAPGPTGAFVGADNELIAVVEAAGSTPRILAFQRYAFTWVAERQALDYTLRVVLPLGLILAVAYLSVFIPRDRFDSAVSLQVTALLSTIALYLAIPKISPEGATLSDQVFVFAEAMIVWIVLLSILRVNFSTLARGWVGRGLATLQIVSAPLLGLAMLRYVEAVRLGVGETVAGKPLGEAAAVFLRALTL